MFKNAKKTKSAILVALLAVVSVAAHAGSAGTEFAAAATTITDWLEGGLGLLLSMGSFAIGLGIGVVKQSIMAVATGVGFALTCAFGPDILTSIVAAGLPIL